MPLTITTNDDETYDGGNETDESSDGAGLSLREAFDLIGAGLSTGPITFAAPGDTFFLNNGPLSVAADITIDGDLNDDGIADIFINNITGTELMTFVVDGVTFENAGASFTLDATGTGNSTATGFRVSADDVEIINSGDIFTQSDVGSLGRIRGSAIDLTGDNFTLTNQLGATLITANRTVIDAFFFDPDTGNEVISGLNTTVVNHGYIEGQDDAIRLASGTITNSGTIRATGVYDLDGPGGSFEPGATSDAIQTFANYDPSFVPDATDLVVVNNLAGGLIEGVRSAMLISGGLTVNNEGTITANVTAISVDQFAIFIDPSVVFFDTIFSLDNAATGIIQRIGGSDGAGFNSYTDLAAIRTGSEMQTATVTNAGQILSTDIVIKAYNAMTLTNEVTGLIQGDTDSMDDDAIAFLGSQFMDFEVETSVSFPFPSSGLNFISTQNISIDDNNQLVTDFGTFPFSGGQVELVSLSNVVAPSLFPLVDLAASQSAGFVVFQSDSNGLLYPASIDVPTADQGVLTVEYVSGSGFTITDANGNPAFAVPVGVDFDDIITNEGLIIGDILTGVGDDTVTNNGDIFGGVNLGLGNDIFDGANGISGQTVFGGDGDDMITGGESNDVITGGDGADKINGGIGSDTANYETSGFRAVINLTSGTANGGDANGDVLTNIENLVGTAFDDFLTGNTDDNILSGNDGDDNLRGLSGDDILFGQEGVDNLTGGGGNDSLEGGAGADMIDGTSGRDEASYASSSSRVVVNLLNGVISGGDAQGDTLINIDDLRGSQFNDIFNGNNSANTLTGDGGNDFLFGRGGRDNLFGGDGNDTLNGGGAFDQLDGGAGDDILTGGVTRDVFLFDDDFGQDRITDFAGFDRIDFSAHSLLNSFADVSAIATQNGADVVIFLDASNQLTLDNFNLADLDASDFIF